MWPRVVFFYVERLLASVGGSRRAGEEGQSRVEYAIIAAVIAVAAMAAIQALGGGIAQVFQNILAAILGIGG